MNYPSIEFTFFKVRIGGMKMIVSSLLAAVALSPSQNDINPLSLAVTPPVIDLHIDSYDWSLQQSRNAEGLKLADGTANCSSSHSTAVGGRTINDVDCGFD